MKNGNTVEFVAVGGFAGFKIAAAEELPQAVEVLGPFQVVKLGTTALVQARQRGQHARYGRRGRKDDRYMSAGAS